MNRNVVVLAALAASFLPVAAFAQASPALPPTGAAPAAAQPAPAPVKPQAIPAKIALIAFETAVVQTNEGQRTVQDVQKKYEPKKAQIDTLSGEVDSLKKQLQAAPATMTDEERASRTRTIDAKEKQLNLDVEGAQTDYQADLQKAYGAVAQKVNVVLQNYVKQNGYTLLLDVSNQQSAVMWALPETDITEAVIQAYNAATPNMTAPPPSAPSAGRPRPSTTTPRTPATTPKPAPPK